jgi:HAD superfamily hydrolase (TIGR01459 family)
VRFQCLSDLAQRYDVIFSDVWGVVHDGVAIHPLARDALLQFRAAGGSVILLSNASRLSAVVGQDLQRLGMISAAYDALITSGDIARDFLSTRPGIAVFDVGPGSASAICEGLNVQFTAMQVADIAICAGAFEDDGNVIARLDPTLRAMAGRQLLLLCANPDVVTQLGERKVKCSGALAEAYAGIGGQVLYAGKPHTLIFEQAMAVASELRGRPPLRRRILVIGDSLRTDIAGAAATGLDSLFVASGIHAQDLGTSPPPTPTALEELFGKTGLRPSVVTWRLVW